MQEHAQTPAKGRDATAAAQDGISLTKEMGESTRSQHARLNRLILSRLPHALPPHASSPAIYATGLAHFAPIYTTFEAAWQRAIAQRPATEPLPLEGAVLASALTHLRIPELLRTDRLRADLKTLAEQSQQQQQQGPAAAAPTPCRDALVAHIAAATASHPHVLIAYMWAMYMALFNGGRLIRAELRDALAAWDPCPGHHDPRDGDRGLSFWHFDGGRDGEDVKDLFKSRLADAEAVLSADQRRAVVREARRIFEACVALVVELDGIVAAAPPGRKGVARPLLERLWGRGVRSVAFFALLVALGGWVAVSVSLPYIAAVAARGGGEGLGG